MATEVERPAQAAPGGDGERVPVLGPGHTYASVTDQISAIVLTRPTSRRTTSRWGRTSA